MQTIKQKNNYTVYKIYFLVICTVNNNTLINDYMKFQA